MRYAHNGISTLTTSLEKRIKNQQQYILSQKPLLRLAIKASRAYYSSHVELEGNTFKTKYGKEIYGVL